MSLVSVMTQHNRKKQSASRKAKIQKQNSTQPSTSVSTRQRGGRQKNGSPTRRPTSLKSSGGSGIESSKTWTVRQENRNVFRVLIPLSRNKDWEAWSLLVSDQHHDNPKARHDLELKHLREAKERGAAIVSAGDQLCLMQGKYDKRSNKSSVRPEHQVDDYVDAVIRTAADFYEPFAHNFVCFGVGNHEQSVSARFETSIIDRLVGAINDRTGASVKSGGYSGWVVYSFVDPRGTIYGSITLHYDHGYGGGGPVTDDMISHFRRSSYLDCDIVISGHTHSAWVREIMKLRLTDDCKIRHDTQTHIKLPTYKEEYGDGFGGWHCEGGKPPKPLGGWWLRFYYDRSEDRVQYEVIRAK